MNHAMRLIAALAILGAAACGGSEDAGPPAWEPILEAQDTGWLLSASGPDGTTIFAAGGTPDAGALFMETDGQWTPVDLGVDVPLLNWVWAPPTGEVWVVGDAGTVLTRDVGGWRKVDVPTDQNLWGVWGHAADDVWAVGGNGRSEGQATVLRYDGTTWSAVDLPQLARPLVYAFFKVWGSGPDDVVIVGQRGAVLRWNGQELVEEDPGTTDDLIALWGVAPDRVVAVGGRNNGVVARWDGATWTARNLAPMPGLNGVWMRRGDRVHVVGQRGTLAVLDPDSLDVLRDESVQTDLDFHAVFGDAGGRLTAVGGSLLFPTAPFSGLAMQRSLDRDE